MTDSATAPSVGDVLTRMLRTAAAAVTESERAALDDEPDGVHQHRVRVRRLRSVLAGMRRLLDRPAVERLRVLYGEWGGQLGTARDIEVRADVADEALDALGSTDAAVRRRLVDDERAEYVRAHARVVELAATPRAAERARLLAEIVASPSILAPEASARVVLADVLRHEARRVRHAAAHADGSVAAYHTVRKAGRRLRYVAEAVIGAEPELLGDEVEELAAAGDDIHGILGSHRDALVFAHRVELARSLAGRAGEPVRVYDELIAHARADAETRLQSIDEPLKRVKAAAKRLP